MGIRKIDLEVCNGCGICYEVCPMDVFRMNQETNKPYIKYLGDCMSCFLCEIKCPADAIYVSTDRERRIPLAW